MTTSRRYSPECLGRALSPMSSTIKRSSEMRLQYVIRAFVLAFHACCLERTQGWLAGADRGVGGALSTVPLQLPLGRVQPDGVAALESVQLSRSVAIVES